MHRNQFEQHDSNLSEETRHLIEEKLWASWGAARAQLKGVNVHRTAELFYESMFEPDQINPEEIQGEAGFDRLNYLTASIITKQKPDKEEFVEAIRRAMTKEADFEKCLFPAAKELLVALSEVGPVTIWTQGDVSGHPEEGYQGSHEQVKKVAFSGLNKLRKETSAERGEEDHREIFSIEASEDKFARIPSIIEKFEIANVEEIVIIDDQLNNVIKAEGIAKENTEIPIYPLWVRQGRRKDTIPEGSELTLDQWKEKLNAAEGVGEVKEQLEKAGLLSKKVGFMVDFDNVLSDDNIRKQVQLESVLNKLQEKGWI